MKTLNQVLQFVIGFFSIMMLWGIGALYGDVFMQDSSFLIQDTDEIIFSCIIPLTVAILIPVTLLIFTIICKRKSLKVMYISALAATALPIISDILATVFSNDANILTWIYHFTIGLILQPFAILAFGVLEGVNSFYFVYKDTVISDGSVIGFFVVTIIISLILYKVIKPKKAVAITE